MALVPREIRIDRSEVAAWVGEWAALPKRGRPTFREHLGTKQEILDLPDRKVHVAARDDIRGDDLDIVDYILLDIRSFVSEDDVSDGEIG